MNLIRFKSPPSVNSTLDKNPNKNNQADEKVQKSSKIKQRSSRKTTTTTTPATTATCPFQSYNFKEQKNQEHDNVWILRDNCKTNIPIAANWLQTKKSKCVHYAPFLTQGKFF